MSPHYFLGASAGFAGAGAGAGAGGAGASAGFASAGLTSSFAAGFGASFALHPIPIAAKLITKAIARKRNIHFFMSLHLLSDRACNSLFLPDEGALTSSDKEISLITFLSNLGSTGFLMIR